MGIEKIIKEYIVSEIMYEKGASSLKNDEPLLEKAIIDSMGFLHPVISHPDKRYACVTLSKAKNL